LSCCTGEQVIAPDNIGDTLACVINHDGQLVCRCATASPDHEVSGNSGDIMLGRTTESIIDRYGSFGNKKADVGLCIVKCKRFAGIVGP
jgi:hypothetical protein